MELSIIVPVYNVQDCLERCLDSLVEQTFTNMEIIVVNDGSPDDCQKIIEKYETNYKNVKGFIKENGGLSDARNYGIERAKGKYIAFVDSDDYVDLNMYEQLLKKANEKDFDIVVCGFEEIYSDHSFIGSSCVKNDLIGSDVVRKQMVDFYPSAWNKIYKRELFEKVQFKKNVWFEDVEMIYRMIPYIHSIGVVEKPFYKYVQREGSISKSNDDRIFHYIDNWNGIVDFYKRNGLYDSYHKELEYCYVRYLYATFIKAATKFDKDKYAVAVQEAIKNVKIKFPRYRRNGYFYKSIKGIYLLFFNKMIAKIYYVITK